MLQTILTALMLLAAFVVVPAHANCDGAQVCLEESPPLPVADTEVLPADDNAIEADNASDLIEGITADLKSRRLMRPRGNNALNKVRRLRQIQPDHDYALNGERYIAKVYLVLARRALKLGDVAMAEQRLNAALKLDKNVPGKQALIESIVAADRLQNTTQPKADATVPDKPRYTTGGADSASPESDSTHEFVAPVMVAIPAGKFVMGSEAGAEDEKPMHEVTVEAFSMSKFEITLEQYRVYALEHGVPAPQYQSDDHNRPVTHVSWEDAQDYARWLSVKTQKPYRLATEAEWEYAARAGTVTPYYTGEDLLGAANCVGCGSEWDGKQTAPVGSFGPNEFGLYDMHGNAWEWVQDCWTDSYFGRGDNSSAIIKKGCERHVVRGGSWANEADYARASYRGNESPIYRHETVGFRVVHDGL